MILNYKQHSDNKIFKVMKLINNNIVTSNKNLSKDKFISFVKKDDFNMIMALFSRMLMNNEWKDYSFQARKNEITFCFYKNSHESPIYKVTFSKKNKKYNEWVIFFNNKKVRTSLYLKQIIQWLEGQHLKVL